VSSAHPRSSRFAAVVSRLLLGEPGDYEQIAGVRSQFGAADAARRPDGWLAGYADRVRSVDRDAAQSALSAVLTPDRLVIVVVGDRALAGPSVEALGLGPIVALDDEGRAPEVQKP
jgi:hypothetical protein